MPSPTGRIYSVGYEGFTAEQFIRRMVDNGVEVLIDVRLNAVSRRKGFSKRALAAALEAAGIEYRHARDLGNPQENRDNFRDGGDIEAGRATMQAILNNGAGQALSELTETARSHRTAVLCVERSHAGCHRSVIIEAAQAIAPDLEVIKVL